MILDTLENGARYQPLHEAFGKAFAFLSDPALAGLPPGRHAIDGDRLFAIVSDGPGRRREEAPLEVHRRYVDIQYVLSGTDEMGWAPAAACAPPAVPYDPDKDIAFLPDRPSAWISVPAGSFAIFFPEDAHAPLVSEGIVRKVVVKIECSRK